MNLSAVIDEAIKLVWKDEIFVDYNNDFLLKEDSLKNAFYYHLRIRLGVGYLKRNKIRIFTEYYLEDNERADLAIVELKPKMEMDSEYHLRDRVKKILAVIELKHKNNRCSQEPFMKDVMKVRKYINKKDYPKCQFYLGFIHETEYSNEDASWLNKRQQESWANGRLTELLAFRETESGEFDMRIFSYNKLNPGLNSKV